MAAPEKKLVRSKSGLRMVTVDDEEASPFLLIEPPWVPDNECDCCQSCRGKFDFLRRRKHHCRRCGRCFCDSCCNTKVALPRMCFIDPVRHCVTCIETTKKENEFFDKHVKTLVNGGQFMLSGKDQSDIESQFLCKLSSDHRFLNFEAESDKYESIKVSNLESLQIMANSRDMEGNTLATGLALKYKNSNDIMTMVKMVVTTGANKKQAQIWIAAMQKAFKMVYEGRQAMKA